MKRPIAQYYSVSSVSGLEPLMDKVIREFCGHLEMRFMGDKCKPFDLGEWLGFCKCNGSRCAIPVGRSIILMKLPGSWDISGAASFSREFGYMDEGRDYDQTISIADKTLD